jgi:hypothetical protein
MNVSQKDLTTFLRKLQETYQRVGGGKVGVDADSVRALVRSNKEAAYRYVELQGIAAAGQPGYLQPAMIVAGAYQVEFGDDTLVELVLKRAKELNAMEHLESMGFAPSMASLQKDSAKPASGATIVVSCNGRDGKPCSLIQIDGVTEAQLRKGISGKCPRCGKEYRVDSTNTTIVDTD